MKFNSFVLASVLMAASLPSFSAEQVQAGFSETDISSLQFGTYAVGSKIIFAKDDAQRFDPWNTAYASDEYRKLLRKIEQSGQSRTVATSIWYPAKASSERLNLNNRVRNPLKAISGQQAKFSDYVLGDPMMYPALVTLYTEALDSVADREGVLLSLSKKSGDTSLLNEFSNEIMNQKRGAFLNAPVADGQFPVIILSHGLGGNYAMWDRAGEFLASHGYIVAAPTFISDGVAPIVFHDPSSEFAKNSSKEEVNQAYQILAEAKVVPNFIKFLFGVEVSSPEVMEHFNPAEHSVVPGGPEKMVDMQRNLFRQRVSDVSTVKKALDTLNLEKKNCLIKATGSLGETCGLFENRIDMSKVGLSGHSLGSMTSQLGLEHIPGVTTAIGLNNGVPYSWTPQEMFGRGNTESGLPVGNQKPLLQLIGNEDAFVQFIFYHLSQQAIGLAKGDTSSIMQLETERATITDSNPQPVALSAYKRATNDKMLVTVNDVNHGSMTQHDVSFNFPKYLQENGKFKFRHIPTRNRKATGKDLDTYGFTGERFELLGWDKTTNGQWFYKPHLIRDYYYLNWFNYYLKGENAARDNLTDAPFIHATSVTTNLE